MAYTNPYSAYRDTAVKTASQGKLVVMLYQGACRELSAAQGCFDAEEKIAARNIEKYGKHISKAQEIIGELQTSLDMDKGGQIAQNLMALYVYFNRELMDATINRDKKKLDFVLNMMTQLSLAWETASNSTANAPAQNITPTLNITG
ncbi:MAG: flagellar export chaperone FliS [Treponema sp.]|nr:flagellar export chaperone FliS [Treponema sp.]